MGQEKDMKFEEIIVRLEEIVKNLESSNTEIQVAIDLYEEGQKLLKLANAKLDAYKAQITHTIDETKTA